MPGASSNAAQASTLKTVGDLQSPNQPAVDVLPGTEWRGEFAVPALEVLDSRGVRSDVVARGGYPVPGARNPALEGRG